MMVVVEQDIANEEQAFSEAEKEVERTLSDQDEDEPYPHTCTIELVSTTRKAYLGKVTWIYRFEAEWTSD